MKVDVLDNKGKILESIELDSSVFGIKPNEFVLKQYLHVFKNNQRQGTSSTKTRSEVSGGGKKPWRQKGTGRARVGSSRNPLWRHGGISHGPTPKSWNKKLSKSIKRLAIISALSLKASKKHIVVLDSLTVSKPNTANMSKILQATNAFGRRTLIVLNTNDMNIRKSVSNISYVETALVNNLNAYEVLLANKIVFLKDSLAGVTEKYTNKKVAAKKESKKTEA